MLAMPIYKYPHPQTWLCVDDLIQTFGAKQYGVDIDFYRVIGSGVASARNDCINHFVELETKHGLSVEGILWLDDDMIWPKGMSLDSNGRTVYGFDILSRLREHDKDMVGCLCTTRKPPFRTNISFVLDDGTIPSVTDPELVGFSKTDLFKVPYMGFACNWTPARTIHRMIDVLGTTKLFDPETNWRDRTDIDGILKAALAANDLDNLKDTMDRVWRTSWYLNEDYSFCRKMQAVGLEVWVDPTIEVLHMGDYAYGRRDFMAMYVKDGKFVGYHEGPGVVA